MGEPLVLNEHQKVIKKALAHNKQKYGKEFCPCVPSYLYTMENAEDYVCKCKAYREEGHCCCGLYPEVNR
jgi:ferredoxin-thioredoxin reductase catalytic subunit